MFGVSSAQGPYCDHSQTNHLFIHLICPHQSLLKRIANIVFHILTLGIPIAIYHIHSCFSSRIHVGNSKEKKIQKTAIAFIKENKIEKSCSPIAQETIKFARLMLKDNPRAIPHQFIAAPKYLKRALSKQELVKKIETYQPVNQEIALLTTLYKKVYLEAFRETIKQHNDPWDNQDVIDAADICMKVSFAISCLSLEDLDLLIKDLAERGIQRTYAQIFKRQESYQHRTFFYCPIFYHWVRGAVYWSSSKNHQKEPISPKKIPEIHSRSFYEKGKIQNTWNVLYNEYCGLVRTYVPELEFADERCFKWTQIDTGENSFSARPDTLPT